MDGAIHVGPVEAGDHSAVQGKERRAHSPPCHGVVQLAVFIETYAPGRVDKCKTQILCHDLCRQVLAPAGGKISLRVCFK